MILKSIKSFRYAFQGLWIMIKMENNVRVHLTATIFVLLLGLSLKLSSGEWLWISLSIFSVWLAEAFNTAMEKLVDLVSPEKNALAGLIKDVAAAGVLLAALFSVTVALLVFTPYIMAFLNL
ncbi:diacylglycerol kinase family protein [Cytophagaceae bacterium ABcell3]|nr:diacylglycerol kinase family protein [Cytophagaceae bacterium ABcell3]